MMTSYHLVTKVKLGWMLRWGSQRRLIHEQAGLQNKGDRPGLGGWWRVSRLTLGLLLGTTSCITTSITTAASCAHTRGEIREEHVSVKSVPFGSLEG